MERKVPKYGKKQKMEKEKKNFYQKIKRSPEETYTQTHGNLFDIFRRSQMSFSIRDFSSDGERHL